MSKALHLEMPQMPGLDDRVRDVLNEKLLRIADALKAAGPGDDLSTLQGPHSGRLAIDPNTEPVGRVFWETDRASLYVVYKLAAIQVWAFQAGLYAAVLAKRPTDLKTHDQGFWFLATDTGEWFEWSGSAWVQRKHASTHQHGGSDEVATATPAANAIPKAKATNKLDIGWIPDLSSLYVAVGATAGGDLTGTYPNPTVATVGTSTAANLHSAEVAANAATSTNTASKIVKRDASGSFGCGPVTLDGQFNNGLTITGTDLDYKSLYLKALSDTYAAAMTFESPTTGQAYVGLENSAGMRIADDAQAARALCVHHSGNQPIEFGTNNTARWLISKSGHLIGVADNTYDIGAAGANRPRNVYIAGNLTFGGSLSGAVAVPSTQSGNLGPGGANTRASGTVYQNTSGKTIWVSVNVGIPVGVASLNALVDASNPPTTAVVTQANNGTGAVTVNVFFPVINGNYYKIDAPGGSSNPLWYEWT